MGYCEYLSIHIHMKGLQDYVTNEKLWNAFKEGNSQAYLRIYDDNYQPLFNYGFKICGDKLLTDDCIQDIFLELWRNRNSVNQVSRIRPYLLQYLKRKVLAEMKRQQRNSEFDDFLTAGLTHESYETRLISNEISEEMSKKLKTAIGELTGRQKEILHLKFYQNLSYEEIAEITSLKIKRVYNVIYEAIKILRNHLLISVPLLLMAL